MTTSKGKASRDKGKRGERELARLLTSLTGNECKRNAQQYIGGNENADVVGLDGIHIECKRVESLNIYKAFEQSINDSKKEEIATVMHRKNGKPWLVTMSLEDFVKLYLQYEKNKKTKGI